MLASLLTRYTVMVEFLKIVLGCIVAAIVYGILHDQVTARLCVEYFTVFHPPVFATQSPTLLGIGWGILATWWMGAILGVLLAISARIGLRPKFTLRRLFPYIFCLLCVMGFCALVAGIFGYFYVGMPEAFRDARIPMEHYRGFGADWCAHMASYASGLLGALTLCVIVMTKRLRNSAG